MTTDPIKALVDLGPDLQKRYDSRSVMNPTGSILLTYEEAPIILAAIEALKPMSDMVMVPREPTEEICNKLRAVLPELFDTSDDTLQEIYTDILAASPASPATVDDGELVERVARALVKQGLFYGNGECLFEVDDAMDLARAALAAINGENEHGK